MDFKYSTFYCSTSAAMNLQPGGVVWVDGAESLPRPITTLARHPVECRNCGAPVRASESACSYCKTERA